MDIAKKNAYSKFMLAKRKELGVSLRSFCKQVNLSPSYYSNMELGKRSAPSFETQCIIADALELNEEERDLMFDLAAKTKRDGTLPSDIAEYVAKDRDVQLFLRKASKEKINGIDLLKLL